jgi:PAS domain S-box-containing protein
LALRLLMLEDDEADAELEIWHLRRAGLEFASQRVAHEADFVAALGDFAPDLILADYSLPGFDGLVALGIAREKAPTIPFIFVTGVMGEEFAIETLHQGAADYVLKSHLSKLPPAVNRALQEAEERRQRRRVEQALAESEERFRKIAESALDGLIILDVDGRVTFINGAAENILRYSPAEVAGRDFHELVVVPGALEAARAGWEKFKISGEGPVVGRTFETNALRQDGEEIPVELSVSSTLIGGNWHAIGIIRDITERKAAERALQRSNRFLRTLSRCNEALVRATDEEGLLSDMCRTVVESGEFRLAWVGFAQDDAAKTIRPVAWFGERGEEYLAGLSLTWADDGRGKGPAERAVRLGELQVEQYLSQDEADLHWTQRIAGFGFQAIIAVPLRLNGHVGGVLAIYAGEANAFAEDVTGLLTELAGDLAYGITTLRARARQREDAQRLEKSLEDTIQAIATTIEARDPYTAGHQRRAARLAAAIAREMGLPEARVVGVQRGAEIHDIGKIYVPSEILNRPGRLSSAEFDLVRSHPEVGYDIVKDVDFPWPVGEMILEHHERVDGSGYPRGLKGDEIVLEAKILAVADVVDAMTSHRPYRVALGLEAALAEIEANRGRFYDPAVADACLRLFQEKRFTFD